MERQSIARESLDVYLDEVRQLFELSEFTVSEYAAKVGCSENFAATRLRELAEAGDLFQRVQRFNGGRSGHWRRMYCCVDRKRDEPAMGDKERTVRAYRLATTFETNEFRASDAYRRVEKEERRGARSARAATFYALAEAGSKKWLVHPSRGRYQFTERFVVDAYEALDRKDETAIEGAKLLGADAERYAVVKKRRDWLRDDPLGRAVDALKSSQNRERMDIIEAMLRESDKTNETLAKRVNLESAWPLLEPLVASGLVAKELEETSNGSFIAFYWWDSEITLADVWERIDADPFVGYWRKERAGL